ncbi:MAG: hypothetical protein H6902_06620 [Rhodobacteraceae bacterium]|nr:hypothetical protein [Paracoccaceae bacterium]
MPVVTAVAPSVKKGRDLWAVFECKLKQINEQFRFLDAVDLCLGQGALLAKQLKAFVGDRLIAHRRG